MKFAVLTLGCDKNTVDSERYIAELVAHGATRAEAMDDADVIVVNTCGFIDAAKRESLDAILDAARQKEDGRCQLVAAVGCMVERHKGELAASLPEVDLFLGTTESERLIPELEARGLLDDAPLLTASRGAALRGRSAARALPQDQRGVRSRVRLLRHSAHARQAPLVCPGRRGARGAAAGDAGSARDQPRGAGSGALRARRARRECLAATPRGVAAARRRCRGIRLLYIYTCRAHAGDARPDRP